MADRTDYERRVFLLTVAAEVGGDTPPEDHGTYKIGQGWITYHDRRLNPYLGELLEGGTVIDKRPIMENDSFAKWVWDCPLVEYDLQPGETNECPEPSPWLLAGLEGTFKTLAVKKTVEPKWSGLDGISLKDYTEYWREKGARIGIRRGDFIEWEDGIKQPVPPFATRYNEKE